MRRYRRYPTYKDSGVEWVGKVPEGWSVKPIFRVASCNDDALPETTESGAVIRYVDISAVNHLDGITKATEIQFGDAPSRARRTARIGDVVVSTVRTYLKAVAAVPVEYADCVYSTGFAVLRSRSGAVDAAFMKWMMLDALLIQAVEAHSEGLSYPAINAAVLIKLKAPIPPLSDQPTIAAAIDRETARIAALIARKTRFIELLREKRQALITHAVTKGLDPNVKMKDSGVEWIGEVPEHWSIPKLRHIAFVQTGLAKGKDTQGIKTVSVPYLRVANVQDGYLDLLDVASIDVPEVDLPRYLLQPGDVLMNEGGDNDKLGRGHIWHGQISPCIHQNHVFAVRPTGVSAEWLNLYSGSVPAQCFFELRAKQTTNLASISSSSLMDLPVPRPTAAEQSAILNFVSRFEVRIKALVDATTRSITLLKERRSAFITAAVTGQIDLRDAASTQPNPEISDATTTLCD